MPRKTRSCKDMSEPVLEHKTIQFPQRKARITCEDKLKFLTTSPQKSPRKRKHSIKNDENSGTPTKRTPCKSLPQSPLIDKTNHEHVASVKKKLSNDNLESECKTLSSIKRKLCISTKKCENVYERARSLLHTSIPERLISRDEELKFVKKFVKTTLVGNKPGSLYISGAPGTGKTASLTKVLENFHTDKLQYKTVFINCMSLKLSQSIFAKVANEISQTNKYTSKDALKYLENTFTTKGNKILLILDEIDQLESKNQNVLYKLFEMPFLPKSRIVLIGIANALDLTDRILPRLQSTDTCLPALLQFAPYTTSEIASIIQERVNEWNFVEKSAVLFCAKKVSSMNGDARKALDILRRAIENVEVEWKRSEDTTLKRVTIAHVSSVCNEVYGSRVKTSISADSGFPLQQQVIICSLLVSLKDKKVKELTLSKLYNAYCKICKSRQITSLSEDECNTSCILLESQGVLSIKTAKQTRNSKVTLRLQESEVKHALKDKALLSSILEDL